MQSSDCDVIVLGLGAMGSAAAWHLARRGRSVIGLDRYRPGHHFGSSHGHTRIIREAYFEAPEYVPLVRRAYQNWRALEAESGRHLLTTLGVVSVGAPDSEIVRGVLRSSELYGVPCERLERDDLVRRFPGIDPPEGMVGVYEPTGGVLDPEACIRANLELASQHGAVFRHEEQIVSWQADGNGVRVTSSHGDYRASRLVVAAGAWTGKILPDLNLPLTPLRVIFAHFDSANPRRYAPESCPISIWDTTDGAFYVVPFLSGQGLKAGRHDAGLPVDPDTMDRRVNAQEVAVLAGSIERLMPGATGEVLLAETCIYTMTPDQHFIIDRHPEHKQVIYACGFSGHGYKFASVFGEVLADLAVDARTLHPIGFLAADRFDSR
jgi:sarcosine oxidase